MKIIRPSQGERKSGKHKRFQGERNDLGKKVGLSGIIFHCEGNQ